MLYVVVAALARCADPEPVDGDGVAPASRVVCGGGDDQPGMRGSAGRENHPAHRLAGLPRRHAADPAAADPGDERHPWVAVQVAACRGGVGYVDRQILAAARHAGGAGIERHQQA
jgi:hypothetical protein